MYLRERIQEQLKAWLEVARLDFQLALRNVLRQRRRSLFGLVSISGGVVAMLLAAGFFEWNYDAMREGMIRARIGHIQVVKPGYLEAGEADPLSYLIPETAPERELIEAFPAVEIVAPRLTFSGLVSMGESTISFLGEGVVPSAEEKLSGALRIVDGVDLSGPKADEAMLGQGLAQTLGVGVGANVILVVKTSSGGVNAKELRVVGVFGTITKAYDDYALRLPLKTAQELLRVKGVHSWLILLDATSRTDSTLARMQEKIPTNDLEFVPWHKTATADFYNKTVSLFSKQVLVVRIMIALIIVLSISNTMMTNVRERIGEIGTSMALGVTRRVVLRRLLAEGIVMGLVGGIVGAIAGIVLAHVISVIGIPMPPPPGMTSGYTAGIMVTPGIVLNALAIAVGTAFLAGLYPARKASRLNIVDALRQAR
ncbi:MAG: ABC transporter permease [Burkholderiales bacterium]|nr:ABC transporter permease [Burkholderiales bacterium]